MTEGTWGVDDWYHLPEREEVMVNVTDLGERELRHLLSKVSEEFLWDGSESDTYVDEFGGVTSWMYLLGATAKGSV